MADVEEVEVVVAHHERATLRVGDVFLKIDADQTRTDVEVEAMAMAPIPTPEVLWRKPPVLALAALPGTALGRLGEPSTASPAAWAAAGAAARMLHDAPLPPWPGRSLDEFASHLDGECEWLVTNDVLPADLVTRNRRVAEAALRPWTPVFTHGDLQIAHVFVDGDEITGVIDWSEAGQGDALYDLATLTLGHEEHLGDVVAGYGTDVDLDVIRAWWSLRSLLAVRWLVEHGFDPSSPRLRGRRAEIPAVRLHEPDGYECRSAASSRPSPEARRLPDQRGHGPSKIPGSRARIARTDGRRATPSVRPLWAWAGLLAVRSRREGASAGLASQLAWTGSAAGMVFIESPTQRGEPHLGCQVDLCSECVELQFDIAERGPMLAAISWRRYLALIAAPATSPMSRPSSIDTCITACRRLVLSLPVCRWLHAGMQARNMPYGRSTVADCGTVYLL